MIGGLAAAPLLLGAIAAAMLFTIVVVRVRGDHRRRRERAVRSAWQVRIAAFLTDRASDPPSAPRSRMERRVLRAVALEALTELRGAERDRLSEFLERTGVVHDASLEVLSRRRRVRRNAAEALSVIQSRQPMNALACGLDDHDLDVRVACAGALAELSEDALMPAVLAVADRASTERPGDVASVLITVGRRSPSSLAAALATARTPEVRRLATAVIGELHLAEHAPLLRQLLANEDDELVARAARGLGMIGDADAVHELLALLDDPERAWFVRLAAATALGSIGDLSAAPALERTLRGADNWTLRSGSARSLAMLGDAGDAALHRALASHQGDARAHALVAREEVTA